MTILAEDQQAFTLKGSFTLEAATKQKNIDIKIDKRNDFPEEKMPGIYQIENDTLTVCSATEGKRSAAFELNAASGVMLSTY